MANGIILYEGSSTIDGSPIVALATGIERGGSNIKTGDMIQVYIMRSDMNPLQAVQTGDDYAICWNCPHRGSVVTDPKTGLRSNVGRSCYVTLMHGPRVVYDAYKRGLYGAVPPAKARKLLRRKPVRLGAYGDPAAVPFAIWDEVLANVTELTGYTHMWRERPELSAFCMASVDSEAERYEAKALGFRTFRIRSKEAPLVKGEGHCPASEEMGKVIQCRDCLLCGGALSKAKADLSIVVHGTGSSHFLRREIA